MQYALSTLKDTIPAFSLQRMLQATYTLLQQIFLVNIYQILRKITVK